MEMSEINRWLERKCQEESCTNISERGYIYCINHLHGFPSKLPDEVIEFLKRRTCYFSMSEKNKSVDYSTVTIGYKMYNFPEWNGYNSITKENVKALGRLFETKESAVRCYAEQCMKATYLEHMLLWVQARIRKQQDENQSLGICLDSSKEIFEGLMLVPCEVIKPEVIKLKSGDVIKSGKVKDNYEEGL